MMSLKKNFWFILFVVMSLVSCMGKRQLLHFKTSEIFKIYLNLDIVEGEDVIAPIIHLQRQNSSTEEPEIYIEYTPSSTFLPRLFEHTQFFSSEPDPFMNETIASIPCDDTTFPNSREFDRYWEETNIILDEKQGIQCFYGSFEPYEHFLVFDPQKNVIKHFILSFGTLNG